MPSSNLSEIDSAFSSNNGLRKRIYSAIDQNPAQTDLFRDISSFILDLIAEPVSEPASKKRKLDDGSGAQNGGTTGSLANASVRAWKTYPGVSFSTPVRKKLTMELVEGKEGGIRGVGSDGSVQFGIAWRDVDQVFCLPIPEKAKRQHCFIVMPFHGDGVLAVPDHLKTAPPEPIVWTFEEATGKNIIEGQDPGPQPMADDLNHCLARAGTRKTVILPSESEFASAIPQSHRKGEVAFHAKAHRGSKDGFLFFLSTGILFGFKKPLAYLPFSSITSISYTNVLAHTFNLVIATPAQDVEFSMIDQADYAGINAYVQKHELQDASMAAARRAKKVNVNPPAEEEMNGVAAGNGDGETELEKAARLMQEQEEEEDDEEEDDDFDPGSEGESEGSGDESEDEEGEGQGAEYGDEVEDEGYEDEDEEVEA
ncbi:Rtt106-domain-containing protein [Sporormia fimetaria CBS 119925]|uniref:Rtt106-domain-containing protein n=1 Tax=Sporormia fimetaria CBS 119925 TaxID=1340428 RepID=A0A6A6UV47_9PLEO|nr:Rtt106-domain-containing protein [Sporormia fimetaria CBS 119925]